MEESDQVKFELFFLSLFLSLFVWNFGGCKTERGKQFLITDPNTVDKFKEQFVDANSSEGRRTED